MVVFYGRRRVSGEKKRIRSGQSGHGLTDGRCRRLASLRRVVTDLTAEPTFEWIEVTIDCLDVEVVAGFWQRLLRLDRVNDPLPGWARLAPTVVGGPVLNFQPVHEPKAGKTRAHLDIRTDDLSGAIHWIEDLGGSHTGETHIYDEGTVAVMADPEGTEFCLVGPPGSALHP
jgi:predicted enzyme related to lactoylglutathione lyase